MEKNKEKKEIKINLWTFYVLVAAIFILLAATISGWLLVAKQNEANKQIENKATVSVVKNV